MNVAVVEAASRVPVVSGTCDGVSAAAGLQSEWIDPEGDDWLSAIYLELTQESTRTPEPGQQPTEMEHWFG